MLVIKETNSRLYQDSNPGLQLYALALVIYITNRRKLEIIAVR